MLVQGFYCLVILWYSISMPHYKGGGTLTDAEDYLRGLPQPINENQIPVFLGYCKKYGLDAAWHAKRCAGFGGSDMGALVSAMQGYRSSYFSSDQQLVREKLLLRFPEPDTRHTRRGKLLEEVARRAYLLKSGAVIDGETKAKLAAIAPPQNHPWLIGNEDDVVLHNGRRLVVDYKVPDTAGVIKETSTEFDHIIQLSHYSLKGKLAGVEYDGGALVVLDLNSSVASAWCDRLDDGVDDEQIDALAKLVVSVDKPGMQILTRPLTFRDDVYQAIFDAGDYYWKEHVLKGLVPESNREPEIELEDAEDFKSAQNDLAQILLIQAQLAELRSHAEKRLNRHVAGATSSKQIPKSVVSATVSSNFSVDQALLALEEDGVNLGDVFDAEEFAFCPVRLAEKVVELGGSLQDKSLLVPKISSAKVKNELTKRGIDPAAFSSPSIRWSLSKTKAAQGDLALLSEEAAAQVTELFPRLNPTLATDSEGPQVSG